MPTITLTPELETALDGLRQLYGTPETDAPAQRTEEPEALTPRNAWEALVLGLGLDAGVSLTDEQVSREAIYEDHD